MRRNKQYEDDNFGIENNDIENQLQPLKPNQIQEQNNVGAAIAVINKVRFRPLRPSDRDEIKFLHEEWFPVTYKDEFYDDLVMQRMFNSGEDLYTCAAIATGNCFNKVNNIGVTEGEDHANTVNVTMDNDNNSEEKFIRSSTVEIDKKKEDRIVACIVGSYVEISKLSASTVDWLVDDPTQYSRMFYIMTLGTIDTYRHCRLATKLVHQVIHQVEADPYCGAIYLHVLTFNLAAIQFYEKHGFYRVTEIKDYYQIDDKNHNCYLYAKYYHGNYGQRDYYYLFKSFVSSIWKRVVTNTFLGQQSVIRAKTIDNMKIR